MIVWLAWLERYRCLWAALPALLGTLDYWLVERLAGSQALLCGSNDTFCAFRIAGLGKCAIEDR